MAAAGPTRLTLQEFDELFQSIKNWGRWGPEDQRGALNFITVEKQLAAAALIRSGERVSCALPLATTTAVDNPNPVTHLMVRAGDLHQPETTAGGTADYFAVAFHGYATTHIDALCHIYYRGQLYNGYPASVVTSNGARALSIDVAESGIVSRGVLLDVPRLRSVEWLEPGTPITVADLEECEKRQGTRVETGDILLVRTGRHVRRTAQGAWPLTEAMAGLHVETLPWLHAREIAVLGSDAASDMAPVPVDSLGSLPIHVGVIAGMGVHILDNCQLDTLAAACTRANRWEFHLTVAPLILHQGTGSPVNPIALF
ncbi:MAG TPA: cyclase family protein [Dehalococcoidia bacterium]|nr:cyclase family protein [Dehalococcoidia bacterium]